MNEKWKLPPLSLFKSYLHPQVDDKDIDHNVKVIIDTYASNGVSLEFVSAKSGPRFTPYIFKITKQNKIWNLETVADEIALLTNAVGGQVRITQNEDYLTVDIPFEFKQREIISLKRMIEKYVSGNYGYRIPISLGVDGENNERFADLVELEHILMTGTTGSGKSVFGNTIITFLMSLFSPKEVQFLLFDFKRIEFAPYKDLSYFPNKVIEEPEDAFKKLEELISTMKRTRLIPGKIDQYPYLVILIDTFSDWIHLDKKRFETLFQELIKDAAKAKIHMVMWDSRGGDLNVFTPIIKSLFPTRIIFNVPSTMDSITVMGQSGAEKLLGMGDMLFLGKNKQQPIRIQGPMITDEEISGIIEFYKKQEGEMSNTL